MKHRLALIIVVLWLALFPYGAVGAAGGIEISGSSAEPDFPYGITFNLEAVSTADIIGIDIECRVLRRSLVPVTCRNEVEFDAGGHVAAVWEWDMQTTGGVPPGTEIEYRWLVEDSSGYTYTSPYYTVVYDDLRYDWRSVTSGEITLRWYDGDSAFARQLIDAADEALLRLSDEFGVSLEHTVRFYIYADAWDLQRSLVNPDIWTGGVAYPDYGAIMIGIEPDNLEWGQRTVAHELGHMVIGELVYGPFGWLPTWLDEGIAMNAEGELTYNFQYSLDQAILKNTLFSIRSISSSFPADAAEAILCYAQSHSVVRFLVDSYGSALFLDLLEIFRVGSTGDEALLQVYGFDTDGLNESWRASLGLGPQPTASPAPTPVPAGSAYTLGAPYIALIAIVVVLAVSTVFLGFSFMRRWR